MAKVLFVCMGNICRSPTAQALFQKWVDEHGLSNSIEIDSAGTHDYHIGEPPDRRTQQAAAKHDVVMSHLKARKVQSEDFEFFDYIIAMDYKNVEFLKNISDSAHHSKIQLLLDYHPHEDLIEVPDPFYGGLRGFDDVFSMVDEATLNLLKAIKDGLN